METFSQHITKDDNNIIRIAAFIADKGIEGATWKELIILFHQHNQLTDDERDELIKYFRLHKPDPKLNENVNRKFRKLVMLLDMGSSFDKDDEKMLMTFEGVSSLLDFIELKHARKNAREAKTYSAWAIVISVFALIVSSVFGYMQLTNKIEIEDSQLKYLHERNDYSAKLDSVNLELKRTNIRLDSLNSNIGFIKKMKRKS